VCLPGGFGTLDELFEALSLKRTHKLEPFPVILVGRAYWDGLLGWLESAAVGAGALSPEDLEALEIIDDPAAVVRRVQECHEGLCRRLGIHRG
jgi:predicted Rossmann-fold nucleotide-binding protein